MTAPWSELVAVLQPGRSTPTVSLVCAHGAVGFDEFRNPDGNLTVRHFYDSLDAQFTDEEMSPRAKAAYVIRMLLARDLEEQYGCSCGYLPFEVEG